MPTLKIKDILNELNFLKNSYNAGADGLPRSILLNCGFVLSHPLWLLFNKSLESGIFRDRWKSAYIRSIHKSGDKKLVENYKPYPYPIDSKNCLKSWLQII